MEQFSVKEWLKNKDRKVCTRYGNRSVRILATDKKNDRPVVALITSSDGKEFMNDYTENGWSDLEEKYPDKYDLFFADEKEESTEFEKEIKKIMDYWCNEVEEAIITDAGVKEISSNLLDLARKEILKSLPKWKKVKNGTGFTTPYIDRMINLIIPDKEGNGYYIPMKELIENLPKED